jgi:hypothetical protein
MQKSESVKNIAKALAQFQAEVKNPANTADNPFYKSKYAPLSDVLNGSRPILSKYGLSILQSPSCEGDSITLTTLIMHESGEWIESDPLTLKMDKATAQGAGSAITYARRYALSAMLGVSSEDDDDGNHASGTYGKQEEAKKPTQTVTQKQLSKLFVVAKDVGMTSEQMKQLIQEKYNKDSSKKLTTKEISELISLLEAEKSA